MTSKNMSNLTLFFIIMLTLKWEYCEAGLRILGGRNVLKNEFPFAECLEEQYTTTTNGVTQVTYHQFCTGAALTSTWILTASHCSDDNTMKSNAVLITTKPPRFARYNSYFPKDLGHLSLLTNVITYPGYLYSREAIKYDIALFQTANVVVSEYGRISAIDYTTLVGHEAVVLGFGDTNATLEEKPLQVLKGMLTKCDEKEGRFYGFLCVVPRCGVEATVCGGDSGGPVVHAAGIIGVTSAAAGTCNEFGHRLYPRRATDIVSAISPFIDWISNVIANKVDKKS